MTTTSDFPTTVRRLGLEWNIALDGSAAGSDAWLADDILQGHDPAELTTSFIGLPHSERNEVLAALIRCARADWFCELAVFLLVHRAVASRVSGHKALRGETGFTRDAMILSAMHTAIQRRSFPHTAQIFSSLVLNTLHELTTRSASLARAMDTEVPSGLMALDPDRGSGSLDSRSEDATPSDRPDDPIQEIVELLAWAADSQTLTSYQIRLLARIHLSGMTLQAVADEDDVTVRTITARTAGARNALKEAVQNHISAWGTWA